MKPLIRPFARCCLLVCAALPLSACGNKGPLTLPTGAAGTQTKAATQKASPTTSANQPADNSSLPSAKPQ